MIERLVKDFMVPLDNYATVSEDATLYDAVIALEEAQKNYVTEAGVHSYPHRAVLVLDKNKAVVGKLSQLDVIKALEPKYQKIISSESIARTATSGFSLDFLKDMFKHYGLFGKPLRVLCQKAFSMKVNNFMYSPGEGEFVRDEDTLEVAVHQLIVGSHQSLLVKRDEKIIGILRLVDVFKEICKTIKACNV